MLCFNTQPPEGGWVVIHSRGRLFVFQHTAARRRLATVGRAKTLFQTFQHTAARRRLQIKTRLKT